jgi:hypothetical protein
LDVKFLRYYCFPRLFLGIWLGMALSGFGMLDKSLYGRYHGLAAPSDCSAQIAALEAHRNEETDTLGASQILIDPVLSTTEQVTSRVQLVEALHTCLDQGLEQRSQGEQQLYTLSEFFLIFAGGYQDLPGNSACYRADLGTSDDPAVIGLREQAKIPPPNGYIFVCLYDSRNAMPTLVGRAFEDPNVKGVTYLTRYIAILDEEKATWPEQALQNQTLPLTVSHELVHAYINSSLGVEKFASMPLWFQEGVAIYFSGSGEDHRVVTPNFSISQTSPADYKQYDLNFKYLQAKLGRSRLLELIRRSVAQGDPALPLQDLSISDERQLVELSNVWANQRIQRRLWLALGVALVLGWSLVNLAPEAECVCGYQGRKNDFRNGDCPRCGRHVFRPSSVARRLFSSIIPGCEVCGRRFLPWQTKELRRYPDTLKVWVDTPSAASGENERFIFARNVCARCIMGSAEIEAEKRQMAWIEIENDRHLLNKTFRAWLDAAPRLPDALSGWAQMLPFEEAVEQLSLSALERRHYTWLEVHADFQFVDHGSFEPTINPPPSYHQAVRKISYQDGAEMELFGTIYRSGEDRIGIVWNP